MPRYFIEVAYDGTNYKGFQIQPNAATIQGALEQALKTFYKTPISLTGSSRTDAGVHALQNFFHFDSELPIAAKHIYNLNALLPQDIAVNNIFLVAADAHCRFNALSRTYRYYIAETKDPFSLNRSYHYPFKLNEDLLHQAAEVIKQQTNFESFSKHHTQVRTFHCNIFNSLWQRQNKQWVYTVEANRFLRGMVKGLVGTMLQVSRTNISLPAFEQLFQAVATRDVDFSAPSKGLFLVQVQFPSNLMNNLF